MNSSVRKQGKKTNSEKEGRRRERRACTTDFLWAQRDSTETAKERNMEMEFIKVKKVIIMKEISLMTLELDLVESLYKTVTYIMVNIIRVNFKYR